MKEKAADNFKLSPAGVLNTLRCLLTGKPPKAADAFEALYCLKKDPWHYETSAYEREKYKDTLSLIEGRCFGRILEIGCGEGVFTKMLAPYGKELLAVDISPTAAERAGRRLADAENVTIKCMDIEKDQPGCGFDLIIISEVLYYMDPPERIRVFCEKALAWLNRGGEVLLAHMRRKSDDTDGFARPILGFPSMGAATVHGIFLQQQRLKLKAQVVRPLYRVDLLNLQEC